MPLVFAHPSFYSAPHPMDFSPPTFYPRMHRSCASPSRCFDGFFAALLLALFLPAIVKVAFLVVGAVLYVASQFAMGVLTVYAVYTLASLACGGDDECSESRPVRKQCGQTAKQAALATPLVVDGMFGPHSTLVMQHMLDQQGFSPGPIDGWLGRRTKSALQSFLTARGYEVGSTNVWCEWPRQSVKALQAWARDQGANPGPIDGMWGRRTSRALQTALNAVGSTKPSSTVREEECTAAPRASTRPSNEECTEAPRAPTRPNTTREELAKQTRRDLSTVRVEEKPDKLRVVLAMPGVRASDVAVSVLARELRVSGESNRDGATYSIDRRIGLPYEVDADSAQATHAHGEMTIEFQRKAGKRIAVVQRDTATCEAVPSQEVEKEAEKEAVDTTAK
jgi:HSP20 family molecular chaperone IbpA